MKIRDKILIYFSSTVITLTALSFAVVYILFSEYREEEFQQQQKEKVKYTIKLLAEYKELSENLVDIMDELTIHDFYDEKMLVFNKEKEIIFSSIDNLPITDYHKILDRLSPSKTWIETKEDDYDIIGIYIENNHNTYYAISKAYDAFGYTKMLFLKNVLIGIFIAISVIVIFISQTISNKISKPISALTNTLNKYDLSSENAKELAVETSSYELQQLTQRFNELLKRTNEAFAFQKHTIHHISHQLKTPIAVLVSELEKTQNYTDIDEVKKVLNGQINKAKSLGSIINVLLEISKIESGQQIKKQDTRIDELIFDIMEELSVIYPDFHFEVNYSPIEINEDKLVASINQILIKQAFQNLLTNCIAYSSNSKAEINIDCTSNNLLKIAIVNSGCPVANEEEKYLFNHFFRGKNSQGKIGFGLGLVLTKKILELNSAKINYSNPEKNLNVFEVEVHLD